MRELAQVRLACISHHSFTAKDAEWAEEEPMETAEKPFKLILSAFLCVLCGEKSGLTALGAIMAGLFLSGCGAPPTPTAGQSAAPASPQAKSSMTERASHPAPAEAAMLGVNLAGGEFGAMPGVFNKDYTYPGAKQFEYCKSKGLGIVRLPFKWERLQRALLGPLDESELKRLDQVAGHARANGIRLLLDLHNYARYNQKLVGTADVPNEALADFWRKLASHYQDESAVFAYGLMNEPFDTNGLWPAAAQACVDAIRSVDMKHAITVCGDGWSGAHSWKTINNDLLLRDPANNLVYEAHQYFDRDSSGTYKQSYADSGAHPLVGVERLRPFAGWLKEHNARGFIGEFGVPGDDPRWLEVLDNFIAAMKENGIGGTYWAAGPWWGDYALSVEPAKGIDRPQMEVLALYAGSRMKPPDAKTTYANASAQAQKPAHQPLEIKKNLPPGSRKAVFDCAVNKESYHYSNDGSEFRSETVEDGGRKARKISYKHQGAIAWVGVGLYLGALDCNGYSAFSLAIRAEKPCVLEVKAYHADDARYTGSFQIGAGWQELAIPFDKLSGAGGSFDSTRPLLKIEFQPNPDHSGSSIFLGEFKLGAP